ncbi:MAG: hypothetical protein Q4A15_05765 [Prevotellaceae bacterium]|nr:hypothetical protein [Prevotellaceae bacterium]
MTREEAKQNLIALGIEEPTGAQVTNYLNQIHSNAPKAEPKGEPNPEPKKDEPKENEEIAKLQNQIKELTEAGIRKDIFAYAATKGLSGEDADKILAGFQNNLDLAKVAIDSMSKIISEKEVAAACAKEKEIANGASNPSGGDGGKKDSDGKSEAEKNAESIAKSMFGNSKSNTIVESYL